MKHILLAIVISLSFCFSSVFAQNVGINENGATPDASAILDVDANVNQNKGILIPRLALTQTTLASPVSSPANSLLIYNSATVNDVKPGYYYWETNKWIKLKIDAWELEGNIGTTPSNTGLSVLANNNFLGTTDAKDLSIVTNGYEKIRVKSDGNSRLRVGLGTIFTQSYVPTFATATPSLLHINDWGTTSNDFAELALTSMNIAKNSLQGIINFAAAGATGTGTDMRRTASIESYLDSVKSNIVTGNLRFYTNVYSSPSGIYSEKMRITGDGKVEVLVGNVFANAFIVTSDVRAKKDFSSYHSNLDKLMQVKTYNYSLLSRERDEKDNIIFTDSIVRQDFGFKAQELYEIFPELVSKPQNEEKELWGVDYSKMVVILTNAIQDQQKMIEELKKEVGELKNELEKK